MAKITIFITKKYKLRAIISEENEPPYEVTINGKEWNKGKGQEHRGIILRKCKTIHSYIADQINEACNPSFEEAK